MKDKDIADALRRYARMIELALGSDLHDAELESAQRGLLELAQVLEGE